MTGWDTRKAARNTRIEAGSRYALGKTVALGALPALLEAVLRPGDRVCLEGKIHDLHMVQSGVVLPEHLDIFDDDL